MARRAVARKRNVHSGTKVKTGCATCRIRKVKCDENKPFCQKCVSTGRTCDGYQSPFRFCTSRPIGNTQTCDIKSDLSLSSIRSTSTEIAPQEIDLLNHYFSIKTIFNVELGCSEEAREVLQASLTDVPVRHAVSSLRAFREDLEMFGRGPTSVAQQNMSYDCGLQRYSMALRTLASKVSSSGSDALRSVLLCCQIFISIEQVQGNYATMAQHIIRGLEIMHEYRARPELTTAGQLLPAHCGELPFLDIFVVKLFATPCKFAEPPVSTDVSEATSAACVISPQQQSVESGNHRAIAPDIRTELTKIAASTVEFLGKVSRVESIANALHLLCDKAALLKALDSWLVGFELVQQEIALPGPEPVSVSFMRFFHLILKIVLLGTLESSPDLYVELQTENDRLQSVADNVNQRLRGYRIPGGGNSSRVERPNIR